MIKFMQKLGLGRIIFAAWAMWLSSFVTMQMFADISQITAAAAGAYATLFGLPAAAVAFWKWQPSKGGDE